MDTLEHIRRVVEGEPAVAFARLYGSRSRQQERPDSDWDVAVYLDRSLSASKRFAVRRRLGATLSGPERPDVDVVVLNDAPPLLAHRALRGTELMTRDRSAYVHFVVRAMAELEDERYFHAVHARERARRLEEERFGRP
jgi:predicted nucleotidyltransferase